MPNDTMQKKIQSLLQIRTTREHLKGFRFVHIMHNNKFNKSIINSINKHFDQTEHCFIYYAGLPEAQFPIPTCKNVFSITDLCLIPPPETVCKYLLHGLFIPKVMVYLYNNPEILNKSYWLVWGGDLYNAPRDAIFDHVKKNVQACVGYGTDLDCYRGIYGIEKPFLPTNVYSPVPYAEIKNIVPPKKDFIHVQVNNSAHFCTPSMLRILRRFKDFPLQVTTILSYGDTEVNAHIIRTGRDAFGDRFNPVLHYMPLEAYLQHLASVDVYILNQNRPQGFTTAYILLAMGKKVFIRSKFNRPLHSDGFMVEDTETLVAQSFKDFCANPYQQKNQLAAEYKLSEAQIKKNWQLLFDY